ncbi:DUF6316 family protein [Microbulbifer magnicolonia]|uniref:DUF6316 family protein n=1 Tax=Microbulbifer magnicolonia TaxID=3109744 RepID=UPI002B400ABC|nr:DUF6316 family protein [Microbulbifer sp. GG15]
MLQHRAGEQGQPIPLRSDRFYKLGDEWYFQIRGGACFGPFACRSEAARTARLFFCPPRDSSGNPTGAVIHPFGSRPAKQRQKNHNL